jgi:TonB family protein
MPRRWFGVSAILALSIAPCLSASGEESLGEAKALYASAAFDEALLALQRLDPAVREGNEARQYRALCLLALGRTADAEQVIATVVTADPLYLPSETDVSPRVYSMFVETRRKLLPAIARKVFADAKDAYQARALDRALPLFERLVQIADDPSASNVSELADLRLLASGFLELSAATNRTEKAAISSSALTSSPPVPVTATSAPATRAVNAPTTPVQSADALGIIGPEIIFQSLPLWVPPDAVAASRSFTGAVRVVISEDGSVISADMARSLHPVYDALVLQAARNWRYKPATRNGVPIKSEKTIEIQLRPR